MDIDYFKTHIEEELEGAKDYIKRAIEIKPMEPAWSKSLVEMSAQELAHANHLFDMFNEYYVILGGSFTEIPKYIVDTREEITEMYTECCAVIKLMHSMYK